MVEVKLRAADSVHSRDESSRSPDERSIGQGTRRDCCVLAGQCHLSRMSGFARSPLAAILGPTNTGKTHLAVERMCAHSSGMIGFPLRLPAREVYARAAAPRGDAPAGAPP